MRRVADVVLGSLALAVLAPVLATIAGLVLLRDGQPVFFRQTRVGRGGRPFLIWKFRTMRAGSKGATITVEGDGRVTALGKRLRAYKLDELPQFWNVVRGDMSMIGPRPEVPDYVRFDDPVWREVLTAKPGITDLASLTFRNEEQLLRTARDAEAYYRSVVLPAKLRLNIRYLRSRTLSTDVRLLWLTAIHSVMPSRAHHPGSLCSAATGTTTEKD